MEIQDTYPLIVTEKVDEARDFYVRWLDMEVTFETDWVVYVSRPAVSSTRFPSTASRTRGTR
jgi:catechol 2,3-dioxygenase-like lactoylglutathione lyase family enzyme